MASWTPPKREPDPLRAAIYDYLRNRTPQVYLEQSNGPRALGRSTETMSTGHPLTIDLTIAPVGVETGSGREVIVFDVSGQVAERDGGYSVAGQVILDRETLAFLKIHATPTKVNILR
ncbi:hypothetical protein JM93_04328 [Roseibium hamelinense]|uniref:Uncharacterized protein n=1 Tax=Roseibium hamelinense TaxID=150831 RepID=A0A562SE52_9HYPH|nr:hypothetical protein [Roseibium hamelinense]MTI42564.1 hypothetical protein [Roseibium hamelinense]TWI79557.1 hypothetical protein JM93_04328 [Roseibium hamelinense]